ncbi:MAG TPA: hypothetical protein VGC76_07830 [Pyrinomonadaceae bacterium]|jgi:hypothetical protein
MNSQTHLLKVGLCLFTLTFALIFQFPQTVHGSVRFLPAYDFADNSGSTTHFSYKFNSITSDGRYLAFATERSGLVSGDGVNNNLTDVYLKDLLLPNRLILVSTVYNSTSAPANGVSDAPSISDENNGKIRIAFRSTSSNIINASLSAAAQIYVKEYDTSTLSLVSTTLVSADSNGAGTADSNIPRISKDGSLLLLEPAPTFQQPVIP